MTQEDERDPTLARAPDGEWEKTMRCLFCDEVLPRDLRETIRLHTESVGSPSFWARNAWVHAACARSVDGPLAQLFRPVVYDEENP